MSITLTAEAYLETLYLEEPYLTSLGQGFMGFQANLTILDTENTVGQQAEGNILDTLSPIGQQAEQFINDFLLPIGMQSEQIVAEITDEIGMQADGNILDATDEIGMQADSVIGGLVPIGMEAFETPLTHIIKGFYLTELYLSTPYLAGRICAIPGMQAEQFVSDLEDPIGMQAEGNILDSLVSIGMQAEGNINFETPIGMQFEGNILDFEDPLGMQTELNIIDFLLPIGMQAEGNIIDFENPIGMQVNQVATTPIGMSATQTLYNTTNLRILCEFPSRGQPLGTPLGTGGVNWTSNSTEPGDFSPNNLNTDIVEQKWRSATGIITGINLTFDTEIVQGIFLDTLCVWNHNLTSSAVVTLLGSNDVSFGSVGISILLQITDENLFYISPDLPLSSFRYWRFVINDPTNGEGFICFGSVTAGSAQILVGECFVDRIQFGFRDFADKVDTEGFTAVTNSRALKKRLQLAFRSLRFQRQNFKLIREVATTFRTSHKCVWIPTPSDTDQDITARFAVFGKLTQIPNETHNSKGPDLDFVDLNVEVDESL